MVKALGYAMIVLAIALALLAGFTLYGEIRSLLYRGCAEISDCSGLISVMVIMAARLWRPP